MQAREHVVFPKTDRDKIVDRMGKVAFAGKETRIKGAHSCRVCGRRIESIARLLAPGFFVHMSGTCDLVKLSTVMKLFPTPYGPAVHIEMLSIFSKIFDIGPRVLVQWKPIFERREQLVDAWILLISWQKAFDLYERLQSPDAYKQGKISIIPPRKLDEVLALRSIEPLVVIDPTDRLEESLRGKLQKLKEFGVEGYEAPF